uniref:Ecdysone receptor n=1 Tax=Eisenia fetida TaxID=6396 RepID=A0A2I7YV05_EISFE|nr:ecdysone receptor [Eisenia fetida]
MTSVGDGDDPLLISDLSDLDITGLIGMGGEYLEGIDTENDELLDEGEALTIKEELTKVSSQRKGGDTSWKELCVICGDRASGFHYNAFSCEGCKGFFRRSITRNASYVCKFGGNCEMDMWMRRKCQACRLRRCREVGMREECLLPESQCKERDARRRARRRQHPAPPPKTRSSGSFSESSPQPPTPPTLAVENPLELLEPAERQMIEKLVAYQDQYEIPSEEAISTLSLSTNLRLSETSSSSYPSLDVSNAVFRHMAEMTILVTHLVIEFAKHLPGFLVLDKDDQIVLLKGSASEVMMLRTARRYDPSSDSVIFGDGTAFNCDALRNGGLQDYVDDMFDFARRMSLLEVDNAEYGLLTAISIFSARPGLRDAKQVEQLQQVYVDTLQAYTKVRRTQQKNFLAKLLLKLVDLTTLSSKHSKLLKDLQIEKGSLPPLLNEYFDIFD